MSTVERSSLSGTQLAAVRRAVHDLRGHRAWVAEVAEVLARPELLVMHDGAIALGARLVRERTLGLLRAFEEVMRREDRLLRSLRRAIDETPPLPSDEAEAEERCH
jgi:hypothetical protein